MKKRFIISLVTLLIVTTFMGCGRSDENTGTVKPWPNDVTKGLSYTLTSQNAVTGEAMDVVYLDGSRTDNGRANDGSYRTTDEMERDLGDDKILLLQGEANRQYTIAFDIQKDYEVFSVLFHNTRQVAGNSLNVRKIEIGTSADTLQEVKYQEKTEKVGVGDLINYRLTFAPMEAKVVRITFDSNDQGICAFEEISLIGYPKGEKDTWLNGNFRSWKGIPQSVSNQ